MPALHLGCCGWNYKDWRGPFYPLDAAPDRAARVCTRRPSRPSRSTARSTGRRPRRRCASGPSGLRSTSGSPSRSRRSITHEKRLVGADAEFDEFVGTTSILGRKRGPLVLQFPRFSRADFEDSGGVPARARRIPRRSRAIGPRSRSRSGTTGGSTMRSSTCCGTTGPPRPSRTSSAAGRRRRTGPPDHGGLRVRPAPRQPQADRGDHEDLGRDRDRPHGRAAGDGRRSSWKRCARFPTSGLWVFANNHLSGHAPAAARRLAAILDAGGA